ncbi:MAG: hypothetical protein LBS01_04340 [Prevotellaceae bacterium]|jgi:hypothetical protein|nr:hypothetical protein [Prevotellaceae bacterium]
MKFQKLVVLILCVSLSSFGYSQISITSYSIYALGINTSKDKKITGELKLFLNENVDNLGAEINGFYNFTKHDYHRLSLGLGVGLYPTSAQISDWGIAVPVQLEVYPLQSFKKLSFVVEIAPSCLFEDMVFSFRHLWGIRYTF